LPSYLRPLGSAPASITLCPLLPSVRCCLSCFSCLSCLSFLSFLREKQSKLGDSKDENGRLNKDAPLLPASASITPFLLCHLCCLQVAEGALRRDKEQRRFLQDQRTLAKEDLDSRKRVLENVAENFPPADEGLETRVRELSLQKKVLKKGVKALRAELERVCPHALLVHLLSDFASSLTVLCESKTNAPGLQVTKEREEAERQTALLESRVDTN
jgi:hypothetical protein